MKKIYLVTHGKKFETPNPGMTETGKQQVRNLLPKLVELTGGNFPEVHVGTGRRLVEILGCLGIRPEEAFFSDLWGSPASKVDSEGEVAMLADGTKITLQNFLSGQHLGPAIREVIGNLPAGSLICSGRPTLVKLFPQMPKGEMKNGALYELHINDTGEITAEIIVDGVVLADRGTGATV